MCQGQRWPRQPGSAHWEPKGGPDASLDSDSPEWSQLGWGRHKQSVEAGWRLSSRGQGHGVQRSSLTQKGGFPRGRDAQYETRRKDWNR